MPPLGKIPAPGNRCPAGKMRAPGKMRRMSIDDPTSWRTALGRAWVRAMAHLGATLRRGHRWSVGNVALVVTMLTGGAVVAAGTLVAGEVYEGVVTGDDGLSGLDQRYLRRHCRCAAPGWTRRSPSSRMSAGPPVCRSSRCPSPSSLVAGVDAGVAHVDCRCRFAHSHRAR